MLIIRKIDRRNAHPDTVGIRIRAVGFLSSCRKIGDFPGEGFPAVEIVRNGISVVVHGLHTYIVGSSAYKRIAAMLDTNIRIGIRPPSRYDQVLFKLQFVFVFHGIWIVGYRGKKIL